MADAEDSKSSDSNIVLVRPQSLAPIKNKIETRPGFDFLFKMSNNQPFLRFNRDKIDKIKKHIIKIV